MMQEEKTNVLKTVSLLLMIEFYLFRVVEIRYFLK